MDSERFGYDDAARTMDLVAETARYHGLEPEKIVQGGVLGSGLGHFVKNHMDGDKIGKPSGPIVLSFDDIFRYLDGNIPLLREDGKDHGHARRLVIGPLSDGDTEHLVCVQEGREHSYQGVSMRRATFWLRVMQLLGVELLLGSNAAGIVTPKTLMPPTLMLVIGDKQYECGDDSPLKGYNDERFGPRHTDMEDLYSENIKKAFRRVAQRLRIPLEEGIYFRAPGPEYETPETIYDLRHILKRMLDEGVDQPGETRFQKRPTKLWKSPKGVVGMSSTYEMKVLQHAVRSESHPAFRRGKGYVSALTNYAAGLGLDGKVLPPSHTEVKEMAKHLEAHFGALMRETLIEMR